MTAEGENKQKCVGKGAGGEKKDGGSLTAR